MVEDKFDFHNLPESHVLHSQDSRGVVGLWKDEVPEGVITKWVAPQPRCYAYEVYGDAGSKVSVKAKGIKRSSAAEILTMERFENQEPTVVTMSKLSSRCHRNFIEQFTRTVNFVDVKSYWLSDGTCRPFGHFRDDPGFRFCTKGQSIFIDSDEDSDSDCPFSRRELESWLEREP